MSKLTASDLQARIDLLEAETKYLENSIKGRIADISAQLTPGSLVKNALNSVVSKPGIQTSFINSAVSIGAGFLGQKLMWGRSAGIGKRLLGAALQAGSSIDIAKSYTIAQKFVSGFLKKNKKPVENEVDF